jgi:hypothetical protein
MTSRCVPILYHLELHANTTSFYMKIHFGHCATSPRSTCLSLPTSDSFSSSRFVPMPHLNNKKRMVFGEAQDMRHAPSKIPQISATFKVFVPLLATSHGGGALVVVVVMGAEVLRSNPRASPPYTYICYNI